MASLRYSNKNLKYGLDKISIIVLQDIEEIGDVLTQNVASFLFVDEILQSSTHVLCQVLFNRQILEERNDHSNAGGLVDSAVQVWIILKNANQTLDKHIKLVIVRIELFRLQIGSLRKIVFDRCFKQFKKTIQDLSHSRSCEYELCVFDILFQIDVDAGNLVCDICVFINVLVLLIELDGIPLKLLIIVEQDSLIFDDGLLQMSQHIRVPDENGIAHFILTKIEQQFLTMKIIHKTRSHQICKNCACILQLVVVLLRS